MSFDAGRDATTPGDYCSINKVPDFWGSISCNTFQATDHFVNGTLNGAVKENSSLYNYLNTTWKDTLLYKVALTKEILLLKKEQYYTLGGSNIRWLNNGISFWLMDPGTNYGDESTITSTYVAGSGEVWGDQLSHQIYSSQNKKFAQLL